MEGDEIYDVSDFTFSHLILDLNQLHLQCFLTRNPNDQNDFQLTDCVAYNTPTEFNSITRIKQIVQATHI